MKGRRVKFGVAVALGVLTGIWAVNKLPLLRGGMHFEAAPTVSEQLAAASLASPDHSVASVRRQSSGSLSQSSFRKSFEETLTLEARHAMVADAVETLLPDDWKRALEILIEFSRPRPNGDLLADILRAGGTEAFLLAAESRAIPNRHLADVLSRADFPDKYEVIADFVAQSPTYSEGLAWLVFESFNGTKDELPALVATAELLMEKFPEQDFEDLLNHLSTTGQSIGGAKGDIFAALKLLAKNGYEESVVAYRQRLSNYDTYGSATSNPEIVGVSEMRRHLQMEAYARIQSDGAEATLDWALTKLDPEFRAKPIRAALSGDIYHDGLSPVLVALRRNSENAQPEPGLLEQAIQLSEKARARTTPETLRIVTQLAAGDPALTKIIERFRNVAEAD